MSIFAAISDRAHSTCELCGSEHSLSVYEIPPTPKASADTALLLCGTCKGQIENPTNLDANHWRCLNDSMWSEYPAIQVMAYRILCLLKEEAWARELLEQLYLDDALVEFAKSGLPEKTPLDSSAPTLDSNGTQLQEGDSVTLIKDLDVKGAGFTAKRGTLVKNITLTNNPKHIEGRVNGIQIVLVAAYLKKA